MTGQRAMALWATALFILGAADALQRRVPVATPVNLLPDDGLSPIPTNPPGLPEGVPRELAPRQASTVPFPAPGFYCGLVGGDPTDVLTCVNARANCVFAGNAVGCCFSSRTRDCTDIPTTCLSSQASCDAACSANTRILRCLVSTEPYCGTYAFAGGRNLYVCRETASMSLQVQHLTDYWSSVLGPNYTTAQPASSSDEPLPTRSTSDEFTLSGRLPSTTSYRTDPTDENSPSNGEDPDDDDDGGSGLSGGALAGIVVGVVAVVGALVAFLVWVFVIKKRKAAPAAAAGGAAIPPMGHPSPPVDPNQGHYAPVESKPIGAPPPEYATYSPHQRPVSHVPEMAGSNLYPPPSVSGQASPHSPVGSIPPSTVSPHMSATHTGPIDPVYEMGPGR